MFLVFVCVRGERKSEREKGVMNGNKLSMVGGQKVGFFGDE